LNKALWIPRIEPSYKSQYEIDFFLFFGKGEWSRGNRGPTA